MPDVLAQELADRRACSADARRRRPVCGSATGSARTSCLVGVFPIVSRGRRSGPSPSQLDGAQLRCGRGGVSEALVAQAATAIKGMRLYRELQQSREEVRQREEWFRSLVQNGVGSDHGDRCPTPPSATRVHRSSAFSASRRRRRRVRSCSTACIRDEAAGFIATLNGLMTRSDGAVTGEGRIGDLDGRWRHIEFTGTNQYANPAINGLVLNGRDVSRAQVARAAVAPPGIA